MQKKKFLLLKFKYHFLKKFGENFEELNFLKSSKSYVLRVRHSTHDSRYVAMFYQIHEDSCLVKTKREREREVVAMKGPRLPERRRKQNDGFVLQVAKGLEGSFARLTSAG